MLMIANPAFNLKFIKKAATFSMQNKGLIRQAYPWMRRKELKRLCEKIDLYVSLGNGNDVSAFEFLKGRVFGLMGAN